MEQGPLSFLLAGKLNGNSMKYRIHISPFARRMRLQCPLYFDFHVTCYSYTFPLVMEPHVCDCRVVQ